MGQKTHPVGFRLGIIRDWDAKWYADKDYAELLLEDMKMRKAIKEQYPEAGISTVEIARLANELSLTVYTARPGVVIGRGGQRVDEMRTLLEGITGKKIQLNIKEIHQPELDAFLVARNLADQLERRSSHRRAMKQSIFRTMQSGALGIKIKCSGRLGGAEIARKETAHEGRVPLHTLRANIDYGCTEAHTTFGRVGVKVWIYKGDILPERKQPEAVEKESPAPVVKIEASSSGPSVVGESGEVNPAEVTDKKLATGISEGEIDATTETGEVSQDA